MALLPKNPRLRPGTESLFGADSGASENVRLAFCSAFLTRAEQFTLRQFLFRRASRGLPYKPHVQALVFKFGPKIASQIWDPITNAQANEEFLKTKSRRATVSLKNAGLISESRLSESDLKFALYNVSLEEIPGWKRQPDGEVKLLKEGRKWIRQKCFVLTRNNADVKPFLDRCSELFSTQDIEPLVELVAKAVEKAQEINIKTSDEAKDDESEFLTSLTNSLTYNDVPGIVDERYLTDVSALWLQDKIRRIMRRNLHCLNSFILKISCMFRTHVSKVFNEIFNQEITTSLLSIYSGNTELLKQWLSGTPPDVARRPGEPVNAIAVADASSDKKVAAKKPNETIQSKNKMATQEPLMPFPRKTPALMKSPLSGRSNGVNKPYGRVFQPHQSPIRPMARAPMMPRFSVSHRGRMGPMGVHPQPHGPMMPMGAHFNQPMVQANDPFDHFAPAPMHHPFVPKPPPTYQREGNYATDMGRFQPYPKGGRPYGRQRWL